MPVFLVLMLLAMDGDTDESCARFALHRARHERAGNSDELATWNSGVLAPPIINLAGHASRLMSCSGRRRWLRWNIQLGSSSLDVDERQDSKSLDR